MYVNEQEKNDLWNATHLPFRERIDNREGIIIDGVKYYNMILLWEYRVVS